MQNWFNLSDPQAEDSLYDIESMRRFVGIERFGHDILDESTILRGFVICWNTINSPS